MKNTNIHKYTQPLISLHCLRLSSQKNRYIISMYISMFIFISILYMRNYQILYLELLVHYFIYFFCSSILQHIQFLFKQNVYQPTCMAVFMVYAYLNCIITNTFFLRLHQYAHNLQSATNKPFLTLYGFNFTCKKVFLLLSCTALPVFAFTFCMNGFTRG